MSEVWTEIDREVAATHMPADQNRMVSPFKAINELLMNLISKNLEFIVGFGFFFLLGELLPLLSLPYR